MTPNPSSPVNSHNEWDPLEEIIVGRLDHATIPPNHISVTFGAPAIARFFLRFVAGFPYPQFMVRPAQRELDEFIGILKGEGVTIRRAEPIQHRAMSRTPDWKSSGFCIACPRDGILILGDEIIETPMAWRCRQFENRAYRPLFKEYFQAGARWTSAPRPQLSDEVFDSNFVAPAKGEPMRFLLNEFEPVFDAADFTRCGKDLFVTRSNATNYMGIEWLRRHLGDRYRIHEIVSKCTVPMHIDSTFIPLAPGKVMINPEFVDVDRLPPILKKWDVLVAPQPDPAPRAIASMCSEWLSLNVLMLDEKRVIVEATQKTLMKSLKDWGFEPIPCPFRHYSPFGGSFHCATLDVRRRGTLQDYFQ